MTTKQGLEYVLAANHLVFMSFLNFNHFLNVFSKTSLEMEDLSIGCAHVHVSEVSNKYLCSGDCIPVCHIVVIVLSGPCVLDV